MSTYQEKLSLLSDMIAFARVDGHVNEREYRFLQIIAKNLKVETDIFESLFTDPAPHLTIKDEHERILHFYRLALLMHADGVLHDKEQVAIHEIGVTMGLSPYATQGVLDAMEQSATGMVDPNFLLGLFRAQQN
jgi:uncharacterized tellurite resistance protein B-like protein